MTWTPELIDRLTDLWRQGLSTAEIGRRLGVSKNAVVGKAHRMNLPGRESPIRSVPRAAPVPKKTFSGPSCQWPIGDPRNTDFHFCGKPALEGRPYCGAHCAVAYTRSSSSNSDSAERTGRAA